MTKKEDTCPHCGTILRNYMEVLGERTHISEVNPVLVELFFKEQKEKIKNECKFYHKDYCEPCTSPDDFKECDLVKIGNQIIVDKFIEQIKVKNDKK